MMIRYATPPRYFLVTILIMIGITLSGCGRGDESADLPEAIPTEDSRPTFPPTFTPEASPTLPATPTITLTPTLTVTLTYTPTLETVPTATATATATPTVTWTPDLSTRVSSGVAPTLTGSGGGGGGSVSGCPGAATTTNLLDNGGFEGGSFLQENKPSLSIPAGWVGFYRPEGATIDYDPDNTEGFRQPNMQIIRAEPPFDNPNRVKEGEQAYYLSGSNKVFDGGIFQRVPTTPGQTVCLSGFAHAWSSHKGTDPSQSLLDTEDDRLNATFMLGIDPTGGDDPFGDTVQWGTPVYLYDIYGTMTSVQTSATGNTITIFVRGITRWRFDHNDLFFDDIILVKIDTP